MNHSACMHIALCEYACSACRIDQMCLATGLLSVLTVQVQPYETLQSQSEASNTQLTVRSTVEVACVGHAALLRQTAVRCTVSVKRTRTDDLTD